MRTAETFLASSLDTVTIKNWRQLTDTTYHYANSMQTSQRKIPVSGGARRCRHELSLVTTGAALPTGVGRFFRQRFRPVKIWNTNIVAVVDDANVKPWPAAQFKLISTNAETYTGGSRRQRFFTDRDFVIREPRPGIERPDRHSLFPRVALRKTGIDPN